MESINKASHVKTRRKFDATFKMEAVRNWLSSGKSAAVIAKELGLNENPLFAWRKLPPSARQLPFPSCCPKKECYRKGSSSKTTFPRWIG